MSCAQTNEELVSVSKIQTTAKIYQSGVATWYGPGFNNQTTSSGQKYDMFDFTAAHRTLPLGSIIRVKNIDNNRFTIVRVNDRGPVNQKLILDLSKVAASNIDLIRKGSARVDVEVLSASANPLKKIFETYKNLANN